MEEMTVKAFDALLFPFSHDSWDHIQDYSEILFMTKRQRESVEILKEFRMVLDEKREYAVKMINDQIDIMIQSPCSPMAYKAYQYALNYAIPYNAFGKANNPFMKLLQKQKRWMEMKMADEVPNLSFYISYHPEKDSFQVHRPETPREKEAFETVVDELLRALNDPLAARSLGAVENASKFLGKIPRLPTSSISDLISLFWERLRLAKDSKEKTAALHALDNPESFKSVVNLEKWAQMLEYVGLRAKAKELRKLYVHRLIRRINNTFLCSSRDDFLIDWSDTIVGLLIGITITNKGICTFPFNNMLERRFNIIKELGSGSFGKVILAFDRQLDRKVALKVVQKSSIHKESHLVRLRREINILKLIQHPHIVKLFDVIETNSKILIVLEYVEGEELYYYIQNRKRLPESEGISIMRQVVSAVQYLHHQKICHRDIKPENIMIDSNGNIKLIDFGFVGLERQECNDLMNTFCGSLFYSPPEILEKKPYSGYNCDVWSMGIVFYLMLHGGLPFAAKDSSTVLSHVQKGFDLTSPHISKDGQDLLEKMLRIDPADRITIDEVNQHRYLNQNELVSCSTESRTLHESHVLQELLVMNEEFKSRKNDDTQKMDVIQIQNLLPQLMIKDKIPSTVVKNEIEHRKNCMK